MKKSWICFLRHGDFFIKNETFLLQRRNVISKRTSTDASNHPISHLHSDGWKNENNSQHQESPARALSKATVRTNENAVTSSQEDSSCRGTAQLRTFAVCLTWTQFLSQQNVRKYVLFFKLLRRGTAQMLLLPQNSDGWWITWQYLFAILTDLKKVCRLLLAGLFSVV